MEASELNTAKKCHSARTSIEGELADLKIEETAIIEAATETRLEKNRARQRILNRDLNTVIVAENRVVSRAPGDAINRLTEQIKETMHHERRLYTDTPLLPTKFVRADAVEHFSKEIDEAKKQVAQIRGQYTGPTTSPSGRINQSISELEQLISAWPENEKLCRTGEQVFALKQEIKNLSEQRVKLQEQQRREALAV